jgi:RND family efflux transporter MFP subunit
MLVPSFAPIWAANGVIPAERREVAPTFEAYAQVEPIRTLTVSAPMAGVLSQLKAVPGDTVKTGALLVRIGGPQAAAALESAQAQVVRARAALKLADRTLDIARAKQREHLATRQAVYGAKAALADAKAQMQSAQTRLNALRTSTTIRAPTDATVLSVLASNGEYVTEGAALLGLQATGELWLRAVYYGRDAAALRVGLKGEFKPADSSNAIPVRVQNILAPARPDGGRGVMLTPIDPSADWYSGEVGSVRLEGDKRAWVAVPTEAVIMDQGRWWVLVQDEHGERSLQVTPGPAIDGWTLINTGLAPGTPVVVADAYLRFHRDFARRYQQPD